MNGIEMLAKVRDIAPDTVRILLTGNADLQAAIDAVNTGNIFRFLTKPCTLEVMVQSLEASLHQYRLITAEKELLEKTMSGSIRMLTSVLSRVAPNVLSRSVHIRDLARQLAESVEAQNAWQVEMSAMLSYVGCALLPPNIFGNLYTETGLAPEEEPIFQTHPEAGYRLINCIPRLEPVAEIIRYQEKRFNGEGPPQGGLSGEAIPLGARILKACLDYDRLVGIGKLPDQAMALLKEHHSRYDPNILRALEKIAIAAKPPSPAPAVAK